MATKFVGFKPAQTTTLQSDFAQARHLCMYATNSLLMNSEGQLNRRPKEVLLLTFHLSGNGDGIWDMVGPIKDTFLGFQPRSDRMTVSFDASRPTGDQNSIDFLAFTKPSNDRNGVFVHKEYFGLSPRDRALTLIHEYVHLRCPENGGDGHPGGQVIMFDEGDVGIDYDKAVKNPYCYQYFADWLCP